MAMTSVSSEPSHTAAQGAQAASGSSFYAGMRVLPKPERDAMYAVYGFCRVVDDIADDQTLPIPQQRLELDAWRADIESLYAGRDPGRADGLRDPVMRYGLEKADFLAVIDGMQMDLEGIVRPSLATLDLYCDRVAVAVGRLSVRIFGMPEGPGVALAHNLGRALQLTNVVRDIDEDADMGRLYLPDELLRDAGIETRDPHAAIAAPGVEQVCSQLADVAHDYFIAADQVMDARPPGRLVAPRLMSAAYAGLLTRLEARGWAAPRKPVKVRKAVLIWLLLRQGLLG